MFSSIPHELQESGLFCCWFYEERNGRMTKVPYSPVSGQPAKSNDPSTFSDFQTAISAPFYDGVGIGIFDGVCAIDLDHCITDSGSYTETAAAIVELMHSYTEKSPGGDGLHILFRAENFQYDAAQYYIMNRAAGIEVYVAGATSKYITVTGQSVNDFPFGDRSAALQEVLNRFMRRPDSKSVIVEKCGENVVNGENLLDDDALLKKAQSSKNGKDFSRLWQGDWSNYPSHSEANLALCSHLAFWTGCNAGQMDRLFRRSELMRDKWDRSQSGTTYGALVIEKAISSCREGYHSSSPTAVPEPEGLFQPFVPLQVETNQLPPFPLEALPKAVREYVEAVAVHTQTSVDMAATMSLGVLAIALQRKFVVEGKPGYIEPANLYLVIVAPPGERKSAVMRAMTSVISRYEQDYNKCHELELKDNRFARKNLEKKIRRLERQLEKSENIETEGELRDLESQLEELPEMKPARFYADDCTPEALTSLLADYNGVFSVLSTEGGIFDILSGRYSKKPNLDTWLKAHCGDDIVVDRKGRDPEHICHPTLSAVLAVQPSVLGDIMGNATMEGRGLLDRFLYCSPASQVGHRTFESPAVPAEIEEEYMFLIYSLMAISYPDEPVQLTLSDDAARCFSAFFLKNEQYLCQKGKTIAGWASKFPGAVLRIAGLLHAAEMSEETVISAMTVSRAILIGRYFLAQAEFAYTQIAVDQEIEKGLLLVSALKDINKETVSHYELYHACRGKFFKEAHDIDDTLELLQEHGHLRLEQPKATGKPGRRPGVQIVVNPAFLHSHHLQH